MLTQPLDEDQLRLPASAMPATGQGRYTRHDSDVLNLLVPAYKHDRVRIDLSVEVPVGQWQCWRTLKHTLFAWAESWTVKCEGKRQLTYDELLMAVAQALSVMFTAAGLRPRRFTVGSPAGTRITWRPGA